MIKKYIKLNKKIIKEKPFIYFANFIIWTTIIILPIIHSYIVSNIFHNLTLKNPHIFISLILALFFVIIINLILIYIGGIIDTLFRFHSRTILQIKILKTTLYDTRDKDHAKIVNIIEKDCLTLQEILSIQMDCFSNIIFYVVGFTILFRIDKILSIILFITTLLITNIVIFNGKNLRELSKRARATSINETNKVEKMILNSNRIKYIDKSHKYMEYTKGLLKENSKSNIKYEINRFIFNEIGGSSFNISILVILVISTISIKNNLDIQNIILFLTYFLYGFNKVDIFIEFYNLFKVSEIAMTNIINITNDDFFDESLNDYNSYKRETNIKKIKNIVLNNKFIKSGDIGVISNYKDLNDFLCEMYDSKYSLGICNPKDTFLTDTIVNNIVFQKTILEDRLKRVLEIVNLDIELSYRDIYSEIISEQANVLSEGQKQRLSIARSIYNSSGIILLYNIFDFIDQQNVIEILTNCCNDGIIIIIYDDGKQTNTSTYLKQLEPKDVAL